jgi:chromosome segregation ATPase
MDKTLTPQKLIDSANFYKTLVEEAANGEVSKGNAKKTTIENEKKTEKANLEASLSEANTQIDLLQKQIKEFEQQASTATNQLSLIDQRYSTQFADVDTKIVAINTAKEQVISSIVDIETGITKNLK